MKTTINLYLRLTTLFVILVFCKIHEAQATEISPLIGFGQENFSFQLAGIGGDRPEMKFEPNISGVSRLGLSIYDFDFGFSFRQSSQDLNPEKGSTTFFDLQLGYQSKNWGIETFYQTYKGFYTESTNTIQLYPDLQFQHYGLMGRYALNESSFSVNGLLNQSDPIKETAGKYYIVTGFRQHRMENSISLLQQDYAGLNPELEALRKLRVTSFNLGVGAGKYWVSSYHVFIGALADVIATYGLYDFEDTAQNTSSSYATLSYNLKIGLGYSGETFKSGLSFATDVTTLKTPGSSFIKSTASRLLLYVRFMF